MYHLFESNRARLPFLTMALSPNVARPQDLANQ
jgi:hypothetical protein